MEEELQKNLKDYIKNVECVCNMLIESNRFTPKKGGCQGNCFPWHYYEKVLLLNR